MEYRTLGRTGLKVSAIGVGGWQLAGPATIDGRPDGFADIGRAAAIRTIQACADLGINFIDTAEVYGDGEGEDRVGEAVRGRRDGWIIATKFGLRRGPAGERIRGAAPAEIRTRLEGSLRRLRMDHVDVYLFHTPPPRAQFDDCVAALLKLREAGLIRHAGVSTADANLIACLARAGVDVALYPHSLVTRSAAARAAVRRHRLGGIVRGVFEGGRLSGRYFQAPPNLAADDIRGAFPRSEWTRYAALASVVPAGWTLAQVAVRHVLDHAETHVALIGGTTADHYAAAAAVVERPRLGSGVRRAIAGWARRLSGESRPRAAVGWLRATVRHLLRGY